MTPTTAATRSVLASPSLIELPPLARRRPESVRARKLEVRGIGCTDNERRASKQKASNVHAPRADARTTIRPTRTRGPGLSPSPLAAFHLAHLRDHTSHQCASLRLQRRRVLAAVAVQQTRS